MSTKGLTLAEMYKIALEIFVTRCKNFHQRHKISSKICHKLNPLSKSRKATKNGGNDPFINKNRNALGHGNTNYDQSPPLFTYRNKGITAFDTTIKYRINNRTTYSLGCIACYQSHLFSKLWFICPYNFFKHKIKLSDPEDKLVWSHLESIVEATFLF